MLISCNNCNKDKDISEFMDGDIQRKNCESCREKNRINKEKEYEKNKEKILERNKKSYNLNKEKIIQQKKEYQQNKVYVNIGCNKCHKDLPETEYDIKPDGKRYSYCKKCIEKQNKKSKEVKTVLDGYQYCKKCRKQKEIKLFGEFKTCQDCRNH